jgi:mono/diheme cytochrome c family protein
MSRQHARFARRLAGAAAAWMVGFGIALSAQAARTVNDGVFTDAQAARGKAAFEKNCTMCHETSRFTGDEFVNHWSGKPLAGLFETVSTTMPEDNPGSLKPEEYGDIVAFFLQLNQYPSGAQELAAAIEPLRAIDMVPRK